MRQAEAGFHRRLGAEKRRPGLRHIGHHEVGAHGVDAGGDRPDVQMMDRRHAGNAQQLPLRAISILATCLPSGYGSPV